MKRDKRQYLLLGFGFFLLLFLFLFISCSRKISTSSYSNLPSPFKFPFSKSSTPLPGLLIANFETDSDDGYAWGSYCAQVLSYKIRYAPHELIYVPNYHWLLRDIRQSGFSDPRTHALALVTEKYYAKAYSVDNVLHGKITKQGDILRFEGKIHQVTKNKESPLISVSGTLSNPSDFFRQLSSTLLGISGINLSRENVDYLAKENCGNSISFPLGMEAFEQPRWQDKTAVKLYGEAIQQDPQFLFAYIDAGERLIAYDKEGSVAFLRHSIDLFPDNGGIQVQYLMSLVDASKWDDAIRQTNQILQGNPSNMVAMVFGIVALCEKKEINRGEELKGKLLKSYPDCWLAHNSARYVAAMHINMAQRGRYISELNENELNTLDTYYPIKQKEGEKALKIHPNSYLLLSELLNLDKSGNASENEIEELFTKITTINPHETTPYEAMIWYYRPGYSNQPEQLRSMLSEAININPDDPEFALLVIKNMSWFAYKPDRKTGYAVIKRDEETYQRAIQIILRNLESYPEYQEYTFQAAESLYDSRLFNDAWKFYDKLPDPPSPIAWNAHEYYLHKAWSASGVDLPDKVIEYADKCLDANPCEICGPNAYMIKGLQYINRNQFDEGFDLLERGIERNPKLANILREYAYWSAQHDYRLEKGMEYIQSAIQLEPENARAYGILARLYYSLDDKNNALTHINKAIQMDPNDEWFPKVKEKILTLP